MAGSYDKVKIDQDNARIMSYNNKAKECMDRILTRQALGQGSTRRDIVKMKTYYNEIGKIIDRMMAEIAPAAGIELIPRTQPVQKICSCVSDNPNRFRRPVEKRDMQTQTIETSDPPGSSLYNDLAAAVESVQNSIKNLALGELVLEESSTVDGQEVNEYIVVHKSDLPTNVDEVDGEGIEILEMSKSDIVECAFISEESNMAESAASFDRIEYKQLRTPDARAVQYFSDNEAAPRFFSID